MELLDKHLDISFNAQKVNMANKNLLSLGLLRLDILFN